MESLPYAYFASPSDQFHLFSFGSMAQISFSAASDLTELDSFLQLHAGHYLFACFSYDLKNQIENVKSENHDRIGFPEMLVWKPEVVMQFDRNSEHCLSGALSPQQKLEWQRIKAQLLAEGDEQKLSAIPFQNDINKAEYLQKIHELKHEIQLGNVYEINFCQEFYAQQVPVFDSWKLIRKLNTLTQAPFSAYLKLENFEVFCGSPERYLKKEGKKLISQPIKGTRPRGHNAVEDERLAQELEADPKERAENIMITDLVRNDFSRFAKKNSVHVDELCKRYAFGTVHQLISTVSCEPKDEISFSDILRASFPMGSMTGAPKISAMQLIEQSENFKRGLYAGTIGYFKPNGDFDFNVVIRSLILNSVTRELSCAVGGAITSNSIPENEYEECLTKVNKIMQLFGHD